MPIRATIKNGKIEFANPEIAFQFQEWKLAHDGCEIVIDQPHHPRSHSQNAYYWAYLTIIAKETGDNENDLHEYFKRKLLPPVFKTIRGEEMKLPASTTDLDKLGFTEYLDKICSLTNVPL